MPNKNLTLLAKYIYDNVGYSNSKTDNGQTIQIKKAYADIWELRSQVLHAKDIKKKTFAGIPIDFVIEYLNKNIAMTKKPKPGKLKQCNINGKVDTISARGSKQVIEYAA